MPIINFKDAAISRKDPANRALLGREVHQTIQMVMYIDNIEAIWMGNRTLRELGYPLGHFSFTANRKVFKLCPGSTFLLSWDEYNLSNIICRVIGITEESVESEEIMVHAIEDIYALGRTTSMDTQSMQTEPEVNPDVSSEKETVRDESIEPLEYVKVTESPFHFSGDNPKVMTLAAKRNPLDIGYQVYLYIGATQPGGWHTNVETFSIYGTLVEEYPANTYMIDEEVGFQIDFASGQSLSPIQNISFEEMVDGRNFAFLGDEIVCIQTMVDVTATRKSFIGINRGRVDTEKTTHPAGTPFFFVGISRFGSRDLGRSQISRRFYFKYVPYNTRNVGEISEAIEMSNLTTLRAIKGYRPAGLQANARSYNARYSDDIILTWNPRVRGGGAGDFIESETDIAQTYEGTFYVRVKVGGAIVRNVEVDAMTWTYTEAMNLSDNGDLPTKVMFFLYPYTDLVAPVSKILGSVATILVRNRNGVDFGSPTTTTTTTTTTTSSTTTSSSTTTTTTTTTSSSSTTSSSTSTSSTVSTTSSSTSSTTSSSSTTTSTTISPYIEETVVDGLYLEPDTSPYTGTTLTTGLSALYDDVYNVAASANYWLLHYSYGIDLGSAKSIARLKCRFLIASGTATDVWYGSSYDSVKVFISSDNSTWTEIEQFDAPPIIDLNSNFGSFYLHLTTPQTARYFKVVCIDTGLAINVTGYSLKITEIEAFSI